MASSAVLLLIHRARFSEVVYMLPFCRRACGFCTVSVFPPTKPYENTATFALICGGKALVCRPACTAVGTLFADTALCFLSVQLVAFAVSRSLRCRHDCFHRQQVRQ